MLYPLLPFLLYICINDTGNYDEQAEIMLDRFISQLNTG